MLNVFPELVPAETVDDEQHNLSRPFDATWHPIWNFFRALRTEQRWNDARNATVFIVR
jgi:hypothetical protein